MMEGDMGIVIEDVALKNGEDGDRELLNSLNTYDLQKEFIYVYSAIPGDGGCKEDEEAYGNTNDNVVIESIENNTAKEKMYQSSAEEKKISHNKEGSVVFEGHCGKVFTYKFNMNRYLDACMNIITCKHCGFQVRGERNYQKHMSNSHSKYVRKLSCETCGREFATQKMLKIHVAKHNHEIGCGKFLCEYCLIYMTQKHSLLRHIRNMHN